MIQAEASIALSGIEPSAVFLACSGCTRLQAEEGCPDDFHLCTKVELMIGKHFTVCSRTDYTLSYIFRYIDTCHASLMYLHIRMTIFTCAF